MRHENTVCSMIACIIKKIDVMHKQFGKLTSVIAYS